MKSAFRYRFKFFTIFLFILIYVQIPVLQGTTLPKSTETQYYLNPARELDLLKKVLSFERNWKSRISGELVIGIIYQGSYPPSTWAMEDWEKMMENLPAADRRVEDIPIVLTSIDIDTVASLENDLKDKKVNFLYFTPLEARKGQKILKNVQPVCTRLKIATFTAIPDYLDSGLAFSFNLKDLRAQIIINLEASRSQGLSFSSHFLRLASIRGKNG